MVPLIAQLLPRYYASSEVTPIPDAFLAIVLVELVLYFSTLPPFWPGGLILCFTAWQLDN